MYEKLKGFFNRSLLYRENLEIKSGFLEEENLSIINLISDISKLKTFPN